MFLIFFMSFCTVLAGPPPKEVRSIKRAIKTKQCAKASQNLQTLLPKYQQAAVLWKLQAEIDECLQKSEEEVYLSYERYLALDGDKKTIQKKLKELEAVLFSAEITIHTGERPLDWSQLNIKLPSTRFVQESEGKYRLRYAQAKPYKLSIISNTPYIESVEKILEGKGLRKFDIKLKRYEEALLSIPAYDPNISLHIFPINRQKDGQVGNIGEHKIGAGPLRVRATLNEKSIEYNVTVPKGKSTLDLPWGYTVEGRSNENNTLLDSALFPPGRKNIVEKNKPFAYKLETFDTIHTSYQLESNPGTIQTLQLNDTLLEKSPFFQEVQHNKSLLEKQQELSKIRRYLLTGGTAVLVQSVAAQLFAHHMAGKANAIDDWTQYDDFKQFSKAARNTQTTAQVMSALGGLLLGSTLYIRFVFEKKLVQDIRDSNDKIDVLKDKPIYITPQESKTEEHNTTKE